MVSVCLTGVVFIDLYSVFVLNTDEAIINSHQRKMNGKIQISIVDLLQMSECV